MRNCCSTLQRESDPLRLHTPVLGRPLTGLSFTHSYSTWKPQSTGHTQGNISTMSSLRTPSAMSWDSSSTLPPLGGVVGQQCRQPSLHSTLNVTSIHVPHETSKLLSQVSSSQTDSKALLKLVKDAYVQKIRRRMTQQQGEQPYMWKDIHPLMSMNQVRTSPHVNNGLPHHKVRDARHHRQRVMHPIKTIKWTKSAKSAPFRSSDHIILLHCFPIFFFTIHICQRVYGKNVGIETKFLIL